MAGEVNKKMDIEFIDEKDLPPIGRKATYGNQLKVFMAELLAHPEAIGKWAKLPFQIPSGSVVTQRWKVKYPDFEFRCTGGNGLPITDPSKKFWTVYVKYEPKG